MMLNQQMLLPDEGLERGIHLLLHRRDGHDVIYDQETGTAWHRVIPHVIENH